MLLHGLLSFFLSSETLRPVESTTITSFVAEFPPFPLLSNYAFAILEKSVFNHDLPLMRQDGEALAATLAREHVPGDAFLLRALATFHFTRNEGTAPERAIGVHTLHTPLVRLVFHRCCHCLVLGFVASGSVCHGYFP